jgi:hypothetical protein
MGVQ